MGSTKRHMEGIVVDVCPERDPACFYECIAVSDAYAVYARNRMNNDGSTTLDMRDLLVYDMDGSATPIDLVERPA